MTLQHNIPTLPNPATDFEWIVENDAVTIDKFLPENATSAVVPAEIDGRPVAKIGVRAFKNRATLTQIVLSKGVKSLGDSVFSGCAALTQVFLPQGLERIENRAFAGCSALTEIVLPDGVREIGESAFFSCSALKEVALPDALQKLGRYPFADATVCRACASVAEKFAAAQKYREQNYAK